MHIFYVVVAILVAVAASFLLTPLIGIVVLVVLGAIGFALFGGGRRSGGTLRTSTPEPTGRPRASHGGAETSNQRQGQA
jgi:hypothetical protein